MPRTKRGRVRTKKRRGFLSQTKGFRGGQKNLIKQAKTAIKKAGKHAYRDRKAKKRLNRRLWQVKINAGAHQHGLSYSKLIDKLKKKNIALDRKVLSVLAEKYPEIFAKVVAEAKNK